MRKFGAIALGTFYLLLTTGMFVCIVHCGAKFLFTKTGHQMAAMHITNHHAAKLPVHGYKGDYPEDNKHKKTCGREEGCSKCNRHGSYVIKENIKAAVDFRLTDIQAEVHTLPYRLLPSQRIICHQQLLWPSTTGPPQAGSEPFYISYRSLLI